MLDIKIVNGEAEKIDFTGTGDEIMDELENVVASILYDIIEQDGFDKEDLGDILNTFANNIEATVDNMEKFADSFKKLC